MANLFTGAAPPNVESTTTTKTEAPSFYTDYMKELTTAGTNALNKPADSMTAPLSALTTGAFAAAPTALTRYQPALTSALTTAQAGSGVDQADISKFYNPYENAVVGGMGAQSAQNVQRNLMPQLKAGFVGSGALGSSRYANALGQTMGDTNQTLLQEQNKYKAAGYQSALDAALKEMGQQSTAASVMQGVGTAEQNAATAGLKSAADLGAIEQAQKQAVIDAPMTRATNAAALMRGYTVPTTASATYKGPATAYQPSPLAQIASLASLYGAANTSGGMSKFLSSIFGGQSPKTINDAINDYFKPGSTTNTTFVDENGNPVNDTTDYENDTNVTDGTT